MRRRWQRLADGAAVVRSRGQFAGWTIGRIVLEADDPLISLRRAAREEVGDEQAAARAFVVELERHARVLAIAQEFGGRPDEAST